MPLPWREAWSLITVPVPQRREPYEPGRRAELRRLIAAGRLEAHRPKQAGSTLVFVDVEAAAPALRMSLDVLMHELTLRRAPCDEEEWEGVEVVDLDDGDFLVFDWPRDARR